MKNIRESLALCSLLLGVTTAHGATLTLTPAGSVPFSTAFGLAFDGTNLHVSTPGGLITELSTNFSGGVALPTGLTTTNPAGWSAIAWSGTQLVGTTGNRVYFFDKGTGANQSITTLTRSGGLIDGLDVDNGGEIFWSRDVSSVDRFDSSGAPIQLDIPIPPGQGFSGVEFIDDANLGKILVVVNDAFSPRRLSVTKLDGTLLGEVSFANSRYEDLAFDGNFLYAADYSGGRIDKYGVNVDGVDVGGGRNVPDTGATLPMLAGALLVVFSAYKRKKA